MIWHKDLIQFLPDDYLNKLCKDCCTIMKTLTSWTSIVPPDEVMDMVPYSMLVLCEAYSRNLDVVDPCLTELYNLMPEIGRLVAYHDIYPKFMTETKLKSDLYWLECEYEEGRISEHDWIPFINAFPEFNLYLKEA